MSELLIPHDQFAGVIREDHFAAYIRAGHLLPVSNFALNLAHIQAITRDPKPAIYFGSFFVSELDPLRLERVARAMDGAHKAAGVPIYTRTSGDNSPHRTIDVGAFNREWQTSKAHTIRSLASFIQERPMPMPTQPTDLLSEENWRAIYTFLQDSANSHAVSVMWHMANRAQDVLVRDAHTQTLKLVYLQSHPSASTLPKRRIKQRVAAKLREQFPGEDIQWLFKEPLDPV